MVGHRRHALRLRRLRRMPGDVERPLPRGVRGAVGVRQAVRRLRCHAMVRTRRETENVQFSCDLVSV